MYTFPLGEKFPNVIPAYIEIAKSSNVKYEWDEENKSMSLKILGSRKQESLYTLLYTLIMKI